MGLSPADPVPAADAAALAALRRRFVERLPQRWQDIEQAPDAAARVAALHRLAGAAGAFGFPALGAAARTAEARAGGDDAAALAAALAGLRELLAAAQEG